MPPGCPAPRRRTGSALLARPQDNEVGCILISRPAFFARDDWVADHADWHLRIQGGKTSEIDPFLPAAMSTWVAFRFARRRRSLSASTVEQHREMSR